MLNFEEFKMGKRLKTGDKPNEYIPIEKDTGLYSEFEKKVTTGRYILEKKTKIKTSEGSRISSCDYNGAGVNRIMVIGQSNGSFTIFNMDTLESI
jgi:hypothetical protein